MEVRNSNFTAFIDVFTSNTYIMVIAAGPKVSTAVIQMNIDAARKHFVKFIPEISWNSLRDIHYSLISSQLMNRTALLQIDVIFDLFEYSMIIHAMCSSLVMIYTYV